MDLFQSQKKIWERIPFHLYENHLDKAFQIIKKY